MTTQVVHTVDSTPVFFSYPQQWCHVPIERFLVKVVVRYFFEYLPWFGVPHIVTPHQSLHIQGCIEYEKVFQTESNPRALYFETEVFPYCGSAIFARYTDGKWGSDMVEGVRWFVERQRPIWTITPKGVIASLADEERNVLKQPDADIVLSARETYARAYEARGLHRGGTP